MNRIVSGELDQPPVKRPPRHRLEAAIRGALVFGGVSLAVYATVAFGERWLYQTLGREGAYGLWAGLFLFGCLRWLPGALVEPASRSRFAAAFLVGFGLYVVIWCACYFVLRGRAGEWAGSIVGPVALGLALGGWVRRPSRSVAIAAAEGAIAVVVGHTIGYFAGSWLHAAVGGPTGMMAWGVAYGLGFGAGIGWSVGPRRGTGTADVRPPASPCPS